MSNKDELLVENTYNEKSRSTDLSDQKIDFISTHNETVLNDIDIIVPEPCYIVNDNHIQNESIIEISTDIQIVEPNLIKNATDQKEKTIINLEVGTSQSIHSPVGPSSCHRRRSISRGRLESISSHDEYHNSTSETMSVLSSDDDGHSNGITFEEFFERKVKKLQPIEIENAAIDSSDIDVENISDCPYLNTSPTHDVNNYLVDHDIHPDHVKLCCIKQCEREVLEDLTLCDMHFHQSKYTDSNRCTYIDISNGKRCENAYFRVSCNYPTLCHSHKLVPLVPEVNAVRYQSSSALEVADDLFSVIQNSYSYDPLIRGIRDQKYGGALNIRVVGSFPEVPKIPKQPDEIELYHSTWNGFHENLAGSSKMFDNSKIPHNVLNKAGHLSGEEILKTSRRKMIRLQNLYLSQFKFIRRLLRQKYQRYVPRHRFEMDTYGSMHKYKRNILNARLYKEYLQLKKYHSYTGRMGLLKRKKYARSKRVLQGIDVLVYHKCRITDCGKRVIPLTHFCIQHILNDQRQLLFHKCPVVKCDKVIVKPSQYCLLHNIYEPNTRPVICVNEDGKVYVDKNKETVVKRSRSKDSIISNTIEESTNESKELNIIDD